MKRFKGIPGAPGVVGGPVVFYRKDSGDQSSRSLEEARALCLEKVRQLYEKTLADVGEEQAKIFSAYEMLLEDDMLISPIQAEIESGKDSGAAITETCTQMAGMLASKGGQYMRQRADDIRYVGEMLVEAVQGGQAQYELPEGETPFILAAHELTPVDTMQFDSDRLLGFVTELGGATSHTVILAKSLGIPAVVGAHGLAEAFGEKSGGYLDGYTGEFVLDADDKAQKQYYARIEEESKLQKELESIRRTKAKTLDGKRISVCINVGSPLDLKEAGDLQFDGVGLYRTEFLYSAQHDAPSFEKQRDAYRKVIEKAAPNPVIVRTLDVGGDKQLPYLNMPEEENPFLGNRGIRLCLHNRALFQLQLEAILAAAETNRVDIMLPMITSLHEIREAREVLKSAEIALRDRGILFSAQVRLGIMIETPASAILAREFAKHCDFFSIGTNDLTQYLLSADRGNPAVGKNYNPFHPAVVRMINQVIQAGNEAGIEVSVCGDLAADLRFTGLLLGFGLRKFSVPLPMVSRIKYKIGETDLIKAEQLAQQVLKLEDEQKIEERLERE